MARSSSWPLTTGRSWPTPHEADRSGAYGSASERLLLIEFSPPGCADARGPLHSWYEETLKAKWRTPQDIKDQYASASICGNNRVVFNVGGNKYRLVVEVQYQAGIVWVKFVGTHAQYDRIDVESVNDY